VARLADTWLCFGYKISARGTKFPRFPRTPPVSAAAALADFSLPLSPFFLLLLGLCLCGRSRPLPVKLCSTPVQKLYFNRLRPRVIRRQQGAKFRAPPPSHIQRSSVAAKASPPCGSSSGEARLGGGEETREVAAAVPGQERVPVAAHLRAVKKEKHSAVLYYVKHMKRK
jgi:hypothetical protein